MLPGPDKQRTWPQPCEDNAHALAHPNFGILPQLWAGSFYVEFELYNVEEHPGGDWFVRRGVANWEGTDELGGVWRIPDPIGRWDCFFRGWDDDSRYPTFSVNLDWDAGNGWVQQHHAEPMGEGGTVFNPRVMDMGYARFDLLTVQEPPPGMQPYTIVRAKSRNLADPAEWPTAEPVRIRPAFMGRL